MRSFEHARAQNPRCRNYYLGAVFTPELLKRLGDEGLVERQYDVIRLIEDVDYREQFLNAFSRGLAVFGYKRDSQGNGSFLLGRAREHYEFSSAPERETASCK